MIIKNKYVFSLIFASMLPACDDQNSKMTIILSSLMSVHTFLLRAFTFGEKVSKLSPLADKIRIIGFILIRTKCGRD